MDGNMEYRYVIRYLLRKRASNAEIKQELDPSFDFVYRWVREYKNGHDTALDQPKSGRPLEIDYSTLAPTVKKVIAENPHVSIDQLLTTFSVSVGTMHRLVTGMLGLKKPSTKWVPHVLSDEQKLKRVQACKTLLEGYKKQSNAFLQALVTMDESWVLSHDPLTRVESMEWVASSSQVSIRPKLDCRKHKVMLCLWWDCGGILFAKFMPDGKTVDSNKYCSQLDEVKKVFNNGRPNRPRRKPIFLQDNARPHKARQTMEKIKQLD